MRMSGFCEQSGYPCSHARADYEIVFTEPGVIKNRYCVVQPTINTAVDKPSFRAAVTGVVEAGVAVVSRFAMSV